MALIEICHKQKSLWQNTLTGIQLVVSVTGFTFSLCVYLLTSNLKVGFFMIWCHAFLCFAALLLLICLLKQYSGRGWLIGHIVFVAIGLLIVTVGTPKDAALAANITETDFSRCVHSNSSGTSVCGATLDLSSLSQSKNTCVLSYPANTCYCCYLFYRRNCSLELEGQTVSYEGATSCEQVQHILQPVLWVYVVICNINFCIALVALLMVFIHYMNYEPAVVPLAYALSDINEEPAVIDEAAAPDITCTQQQTVHHDPQPINPPQMHYYPQPIKPPAYDAPSHPPRRPFRVCRPTDTPRATVPSRQNIYTIPTSTSQLPTGDQHYNPNPITPPAYDAPSHPPRRPFRVCRPTDTPRATVPSRQNIYTIPTSTSQLPTGDQHYNPNPITPPAYDARSHPPPRPFRVCRPTDTPRATVPSRQNIYTIPTCTSQLPTGGATNQNATMATDDSNIVYSHTPPPPYSP